MERYWFRFTRDGGLPVIFPAFAEERRHYRWTGLYGVQIGPWFFGAVKGRPEAPAPAGEPEPDVDPADVADTADEMPTDVATLHRDLRADRAIIRKLARQASGGPLAFDWLSLLYLGKRGTMTPTQPLRRLMGVYEEVRR